MNCLADRLPVIHLCDVSPVAILTGQSALLTEPHRIVKNQWGNVEVCTKWKTKVSTN